MNVVATLRTAWDHIKFNLRYLRNLVPLVFLGKVTWSAAKMAMIKKPIAVAGKGGSYIVDPDMES